MCGEPVTELLTYQCLNESVGKKVMKMKMYSLLASTHKKLQTNYRQREVKAINKNDVPLKLNK